MKRKNRDEVDAKPSFENIVVGNKPQVSYTTMGFLVNITLDKVEKQIHPKTKFNKEFKIFCKLVVLWRLKRDIIHVHHT